MEKQKKVAITKGWCIFLAIIGIISLIGTPSLASMAERITSQSTTTGIGTIVERNNPQSNNIVTDNHGIPSFDDPRGRGTLNVIPYGFQVLGTGTAAGWTTEAFHTGSYSVKLTTTNTGDYAAVYVNYNLALSGLDSISFWYKHTAYANYCGPRVSIGIDNDTNGVIDHLVISADVGQATDWTQRNLPTDDNRWWYGTYVSGVYTQEGGPVTFDWIKSHYSSAYVRNLAFYMGVVGSGAGAGSVYIDDIAINAVTYYGKIQDAIVVATADDTINIAAGTYDEQIVIDGKRLTLQGAGDSTIIRPSAPGTLTSLYTYPTGMPYWAGSSVASIIIAKNVGGTGVTVKNLKVDGADITSLPSGANMLAGVLYGECAGLIQNIAVNTIKTTGYADRTYGIDTSAVDSAVSVEVSGCRITDYARNGIMANGGSLIVNIHNNIITGPGSIGPVNVPNGIVFMKDVGGSVIGNTIHNCHFNVALSYRSVGIMEFDVCQPGVVIENNEVYDVDDAINTYNQAIIRNNNLHGNGFGVVLEWGAYDNQIVNNIITGNTNGIQLNGALNPNPKGRDPPGPGNFAHYNDIFSNTMGLVSYDNTQIFNAVDNWWGDKTGPSGSGNPVSGNVDYYPWIDTNPPWSVVLNFKKQGDTHTWDTATFGEKIYASDGQDAYDIPKPGIPPHPYIYAWFDAGLSAPYNKLWEDYRFFPHETEVWDLYVRANTNLPSLGTTDVVISWNTAAINTSEYTHVDLYDASDVHLADMTTKNSYTLLSVPDDTNIYLKIKCLMNHAPTSADKTVTTLEDTAYTFGLADFTFSDPDTGDQLEKVQITQLETDGSLELSSVPVTLDQEISRANIVAGNLKFVPDSNENGIGYANFKFKVSDGDVYSASEYTMTIDVTAQNDPPVVGGIPDQTINQGDSFGTFDLDDYVTDVDNTPAEITWVPSGYTDLGVSIDSGTHVVTITIPSNWYGAEDITFTATDPGSLSDFDTVKFTVLQYHHLNVKTSWNLISNPCYETISKTNIKVRYLGVDYTWAQATTNDNPTGSPIILGSLYDWDRTNQQYSNPATITTLIPGTGYWMWAYHDCELLIASNAAPPSSKHITNLQQKWNIMGLPYETSLVPANLKINYSGTNYTWAQAVANHIILGFIYGWDNTNQIYTLKDTFQPGEGYWMYAYYDCKLYRGD